MRHLRTALPWLAGMAILVALFATVDVDATVAALSQCDLIFYVPVAFGFVAVWLAIDAFVLSRLFSALAGRIPWSDMVQARASTYPLMALSFHLSNAALVASLGRITGARLSTLTGGMLVHYMGDLLALAGITAVSLSFASSEILVFLRLPLMALCAGLVVTLGLGRLGRGLLRGRPVVEVLGELSFGDLARLVAGRCVWYASFIAFVWFTLPAFELAGSLADVGARMPIVMTIGALPITPAGIGTTQAAMLALFGDFGATAAVFAYALVYGATLVVLRVVVGFAFWTLASGVFG